VPKHYDANPRAASSRRMISAAQHRTCLPTNGVSVQRRLRQMRRQDASLVASRFRAISRGSRWETGAEGFEPSHQEFVSRWLTAVVPCGMADRASACCEVGRTICCHSPRRAIAMGPSGTIPDAKVRIPRPSQLVRSQPPNIRMRLRTARHRDISPIWLGLRVRNLATEAPFRPPVSEATFWCLVFDVVCRVEGAPHRRHPYIPTGMEGQDESNSGNFGKVIFQSDRLHKLARNSTLASAQVLIARTAGNF
jgi:hypothetical protein